MSWIVSFTRDRAYLTRYLVASTVVAEDVNGRITKQDIRTVS